MTACSTVGQILGVQAERAWAPAGITAESWKELSVAERRDVFPEWGVNSKVMPPLGCHLTS